jgi:hypothetical protein
VPSRRDHNLLSRLGATDHHLEPQRAVESVPRVRGVGPGTLPGLMAKGRHGAARHRSRSWHVSRIAATVPSRATHAYPQRVHRQLGDPALWADLPQITEQAEGMNQAVASQLTVDSVRMATSRQVV